MNRRTFLKTAGGAAGGAAAMSTGAAPASAASSGTTEGGGGGGGGGEPDLGGYLDDANNFSGSVTDMTGQDEVTVEVGAGSGLAYGPAAVHVDNGATVTWEWVGGSHNVVHEDGEFESGAPESGATYEYTFESDGVYQYYCTPHKGSGMKGVVVVGTDYPTKAAGASTPLDVSHMGSSIREHYVGFAVVLAISISMVFTFFMLKYGESAHTSGGNN